MKLKSRIDILRGVKVFSDEKGVHLSPKTCSIFVFLVELCFTEGNFDDEKQMYFVQYSSAELAEMFHASKNMIDKAFYALKECGLINYTTSYTRSLSYGKLTFVMSNLEFVRLRMENIISKLKENLGADDNMKAIDEIAEKHEMLLHELEQIVSSNSKLLDSSDSSDLDPSFLNYNISVHSPRITYVDLKPFIVD